MSDRSKRESGMSEARYGRLCEYAFGEMGVVERAAFELELAADVELQKALAELQATAEGVRNALPAESLSESMRATLRQAAGAGSASGPRGLLRGGRKGLLQLAAGLVALLGVSYALRGWMREGAVNDPSAGGAQGGKLDLARLEKGQAPNSGGLHGPAAGSSPLGLEAAERSGESFSKRFDADGKALLGEADLEQEVLEESEVALSTTQTEAQARSAVPSMKEIQAKIDQARQAIAVQQQANDLGLVKVSKLLEIGTLSGTEGSQSLQFSEAGIVQTTDSTQALVGAVSTSDSGQDPVQIQAERQKQVRPYSVSGEFPGVGLELKVAAQAVPGWDAFHGPGDSVPASGVAPGGAAGQFVASGPGSPGPQTGTGVGPGGDHLDRPGSGASGPASSRAAGPSGPGASGAQASAAAGGPATLGPLAPGAPAARSRVVPSLNPGTTSIDPQTGSASALPQAVSRTPASASTSVAASNLDFAGFLGLDSGAAALAQKEEASKSAAGESLYLGRGAQAAELADGAQDDQPRGNVRRPVPSREQVQEITRRLLTQCVVRPQEAPKDMFFRAWGEHPFRQTASEPVSTFGADVDTASYTLARRTLRAGLLPEKEQIRSEEFLNYFRADQPAPERGQVFGLHLESAPSLFHTDPMVELLRVTLRGQDVEDFERKPLALTLVVDVSGSMKDANRMPLVKRSLALLLTQLSYSDSVSIVAFSTEAKVLSGMVSAAQRSELEEALFKLNPEGGTNIEAGITRGFEVAAAGLVEGAVNRVILLSDGVGNIGEVDQARILEQVASLREKGIYLNTIGVGMGDHNDHFLEQLANRGDGQCQYFDSAKEAEKVLVNDLTRTLQPIARDVKLQVEFDPNQVLSWRQIGYENRAIAARDFRNDAVDAGEVNAGHQVSALYEIVRQPGASREKPLATARVRYKLPFVSGADEAQRLAAEEALEITQSIAARDLLPSYRGAGWGYRRAVLVAQFAECLRRSIHARGDSLQILQQEVIALAVERDELELFELKELVTRAVPMLIDEAENLDMELLGMVDALRRLNYEVARREQTRGTDAPDVELEAASQAAIQTLEARIARHLLQRAGYGEEVPPIPQARLEALGYGATEDER